MNERVVEHMNRWAFERDILCLISGWAQRPIHDAFPRMLGVVTASIALIGALAPVLTDALRGADGGYTLAILVYAALAVLAAPLVAMVRHRGSD